MTPTPFLEELTQLDVRLSVEGDTLKVNAPKGVVTPELRARLSEQKAALLALLCSPRAEPEAPVVEEPTPELAGQCSQCPAPVEHYSASGTSYCTEHWGSRPPLESLLQEVNELIAQLGDAPAPLAVDLETTGLSVHEDRIISITLLTPGGVRILDLRPYYDLPEAGQAEWRAALVTLFHRPEVTWIGHNLKFDWGFLAAHFGVHLARIYDTMLVEQVLCGVGLHEGGTAVTLAATAARYGMAVSKEERSWFVGLHRRPGEWTAPFPQEQRAYMAQDVLVATRIREQQRPQLRQEGLEVVADLENGALPAIAAMEVHGVLVDAERWRGILTRKRERQEALARELAEELGSALMGAKARHYQEQLAACQAHEHALEAEEKRLMTLYQQEAGKSSWQAYRAVKLGAWKAAHPRPKRPTSPEGSINLASPTQLKEALGKLGIPVASTEVAALEPYAARSQVVAKVLQWKKLQKIVSAFGENVLARIGPDGRLHADFAQIGATTGRMSCSHPNLQQIPARDVEEENLRRCFIAPPGCSLIKADLSNIELRILAEVAQDATMLHFFAEGKDLHAETAKLMFGLPAETDTKKHHYKDTVSVRDVAKTINFGLAYGMGAQGLATRVGTSVEDARGLMNTYFRTYAGVAAWLRLAARQAVRDGYSRTIAGRKRYYRHTDANQGQRALVERQAKNHPISGTNADILKRTLARLSQELPVGAHLILAVHDEVVVECPDPVIEQVAVCVRRVMVEACRDYLTIVHVPPPEIVVAPYWKKD